MAYSLQLKKIILIFNLHQAYNIMLSPMTRKYYLVVSTSREFEK
jgi:hypothetical protein